MEKINNALWLWAQFSKEDTKFLSYIQKQLSPELKGTEFPLHLTLAGPFNNLHESRIEELKLCCSQFPPIKLENLIYKDDSEFFHSLFIEVDYSNQLNELRNRLFAIYEMVPTGYYSPHISLIYGDYDSQVKQSLIRTLPALVDTVLIDKVSIVSITNNICQWKILKKLSLMNSRL